MLSTTIGMATNKVLFQNFLLSKRGITWTIHYQDSYYTRTACENEHGLALQRNASAIKKKVTMRHTFFRYTNIELFS